MNERIKNSEEPAELTPEQEIEQTVEYWLAHYEAAELTPEQERAENLEYWLAQYETPETPPEERLECESFINEFERLLSVFEEEFSLGELHAIIRAPDELSPETPEERMRNSAKKSLVPIVKQLNFLKDETNITKERHDALKESYLKLSRAVGIVNGNIIDHTRF